MCGIAGQFSFTGSPTIDTLEEMNACVAHRGPDDAGIFQDGPVGLAHRRLSIIDLETGAQPIYNEDDSVVVIFNGEIYNYQSLRESLSSAGHEFTTETDTEVLVHLYEDHGPSFVSQLEGMFAFALWDAEQEQLLLARDPMGIKPLVIAETTNEIGFASELPSLLGAGLDHGGLDREALAQYFAFGYIPTPKTAFQNITKLRPGEYAVISADGIPSVDSVLTTRRPSHRWPQTTQSVRTWAPAPTSCSTLTHMITTSSRSRRPSTTTSRTPVHTRRFDMESC